MKPTDLRLATLAAEAKVRPPHIFHTFHAIAADPLGFDPAAFALFAMLELRHVEAIVAALRASGLYPERRARESASQPQKHGTRLPPAMQLPDDWLAYAQSKRKWDKPTVEDVLADFIEYWSNRTDARAVKHDWTLTWQSWVRKDRRPDGTWAPAVDGFAGLSWAEQCEQIAQGWERMDNPSEAAKWRGKISG